MKKLFFFTLALAMLLSVFACSGIAFADSSCDCPAGCDCRLRELTPMEREIIFYQVAAEKGINAAAMIAASYQQTQQAVTQAPPPQSTLAPLYDVGPSPVDEDFIAIEEIKLVYYGNGLYKPDIKVRCLYPEDALQTYPQDLNLYCNFLDSNGDIVHSFTACFSHLSYGKAMWASANNFSHMNGENTFDPTEVSQIEFTWYHMKTISGGRVAWQQEWDLLEPVIFNVADLESDVPLGADIAVREDANVIVFDEPVKLYEDEKIGVELSSLYQKESMGEMHKYISLKIHNKTDRSWLFHLDGLYLDGEAAHRAMVDGNSGPDAGITQEFRYMIAYDNGSEEKPLDSLEQLLKADMKLSVDLYDKTEEYLEDDFIVRFSYDVTDLVP